MNLRRPMGPIYATARTWTFAPLLLGVLLACTPPGDEKQEPQAWPMEIKISPDSAGSPLGSGTSIQLVFEREIRELKLKDTKNKPLVALTIWRTSLVSGKSVVDIVALEIKQSDVDAAKIVTLSNIAVPPITAKKKGLSPTVQDETNRLRAKFPVDSSGNLTLQKGDVLALILATGAVADTNGNQNPKEAIRRVIVE